MQDDNKARQSVRKLSPKAIGRVRAIIRRNDYLSNPHPPSPTSHKDLRKKVEMSGDLVDCS